MYTIEEVTTKEQLSILAETAEEIWNEYFTLIIGKAQVDYMVDKFQSYDAIGAAIDGGYKYYMLSSDGAPCGYCGVHKEDTGRLFLSKLYVKKEFHKRGLSRKMLNHAIEDNSPISAVYLTVNKHNDPTIAVYNHIGFKTIDAVVTDIGGGFVMDDYIMELTV